MNSAFPLLLIVSLVIIGSASACFDFCPIECTANGCDVWICETAFDCFCDECYGFEAPIALSALQAARDAEGSPL